MRPHVLVVDDDLHYPEAATAAAKAVAP